MLLNSRRIFFLLVISGLICVSGYSILSTFLRPHFLTRPVTAAAPQTLVSPNSVLKTQALLGEARQLLDQAQKERDSPQPPEVQPDLKVQILNEKPTASSGVALVAEQIRELEPQLAEIRKASQAGEAQENRRAALTAQTLDKLSQSVDLALSNTSP